MKTLTLVLMGSARLALTATQIAAQSGDRAKAINYYRRFLGYWGEGEMDRDKVAEARKKLN